MSEVINSVPEITHLKEYRILKNESLEVAKNVWNKILDLHTSETEVRNAVRTQIQIWANESNGNRFMAEELARLCTEKYGDVSPYQVTRMAA